MAFPFGGHPTLRRFVEFAQEQSCEAQVFVRIANTGRAHQVLRIENNSGSWVLVHDPDFDEHLSPTTVAYLQRRLGIITPFAALPGPPSEPDDD